MELRQHQEQFLDDLRGAFRAGRRRVLGVAPTGMGKCLGIGTPVLRFDGRIVPVDDVRIGDLLIGPDSRPRRVLGTTRGAGDLYRVSPVRGESWVCNDVHVLTLVHTQTSEIVDVDLPSYLSASKDFRRLHKQFTPESGIDFFPADPLPLDPYFLGVWYGDGTKALNDVAISKPDPEILALCHRIAEQFGLRVTTRTESGGCPTHHLVGPLGGPRDNSNPLLTLLRTIVGDGITLPHSYLTASRGDRLAFMAGLMDTDGHMRGGGFEIVQKQIGFSEGICFLARSLGLRAIMTPKDVNGVRYWRVAISGNCSVIPTRIPRKRAPERKQIKCATRIGIRVERIGVGEYAGFELNGDGRFLLGDFTVTHNTLCGATMARGAVANGHRVLFAAGRRELIRQTVATFARCAGVEPDGAIAAVVESLARTSTPVRVIQASDDIGPTDAPIVVGSIQTLSMPRWLGALQPVQFGILDEAHHGKAATWSDLVDSQPAARWVGLSATPERGDGKALDLFDALVPGPSVHMLTELGYLVPCRIWSGPATLKPGELAMTPLEAYQRFAPGQRCAVFCRDRAHARTELSIFQAAGVPAAVITGDMPDRARDAALAAWRNGSTLVALSVNVLTEGFDMPELGVAILARRFNHVGAYLQAGGRIIRAAPGKSQATLIDLTGCAHEHGPLELDRTYSLTGKAIRNAAARDGFGQCKACGTMFLYGPRVCAVCGAEIPTRPVVMPRSVGAGVTELGQARPRTPWVSALAAKRDGRCRKCGQWFRRGTAIFYTQGEYGSERHQKCPAPSLQTEARP